MFSRKIGLWFVILTMSAIFIPSSPSLAQDSAVVTAEVMVDTLNVRFSPRVLDIRGDMATKIGELHLGDVVIVQQYETIPGRGNYAQYPWVYIVQESSGLKGWIYSEYLTLSRVDWQRYVVEVTHWADVNRPEFDVPEPYAGKIWTQSSSIQVSSEPYEGAPIVGYVHHQDPVFIQGVARINGQYSRYIYIQQIDTGVRGWIILWHVVSYLQQRNDWYSLLPVLLEHNYYEELAHLPTAVPVAFSLNLRDYPSTSGNRLLSVSSRHELAVHGRTNHAQEGWVYVTILASGLSGWVYDPVWDTPYLRYQDGVTRDSLPIISP